MLMMTTRASLLKTFFYESIQLKIIKNKIRKFESSIQLLYISLNRRTRPKHLITFIQLSNMIRDEEEKVYFKKIKIFN